VRHRPGRFLSVPLFQQALRPVPERAAASSATVLLVSIWYDQFLSAVKAFLDTVQ
jgi:hypothetical protein